MIYVGSELKVVDNSGGRIAECIKVFRTSPQKPGSAGDVILVSIKKSLPGKKVKKGEMYRGVIVRLEKRVNRKEGSSISFDGNGVVLLTGKNVPVGNRVYGPVFIELRSKGFMKVISISMLAI